MILVSNFMIFDTLYFEPNKSLFIHQVLKLTEIPEYSLLMINGLISTFRSIEGTLGKSTQIIDRSILKNFHTHPVFYVIGKPLKYIQSYNFCILRL